MNWTYLSVNFGTILIPLIFSFHPKLKFYKRWKSTWLSICLVAVVFILWDIWFTKLGVWGFNPEYLSGVTILNLPIEEWMFFITVPYACMYTYHCLSILIEPKKWLNIKWFSGILIIFLLGLAVVFFDRIYTVITFVSLSLSIFLIQFIMNPKWLPRLYLSLLILVIPFVIVNGILTGFFTEGPVVWYSNSDLIGVRFITIPLEDFFYGSLLIMLNVFCMELLSFPFKEVEIRDRYIGE